MPSVPHRAFLALAPFGHTTSPAPTTSTAGVAPAPAWGAHRPPDPPSSGYALGLARVLRTYKHPHVTACMSATRSRLRLPMPIARRIKQNAGGSLWRCYALATTCRLLQSRAFWPGLRPRLFRAPSRLWPCQKTAGGSIWRCSALATLCRLLPCVLSSGCALGNAPVFRVCKQPHVAACIPETRSRCAYRCPLPSGSQPRSPFMARPRGAVLYFRGFCFRLLPECSRWQFPISQCPVNFAGLARGFPEPPPHSPTDGWRLPMPRASLLPWRRRVLALRARRRPCGVRWGPPSPASSAPVGPPSPLSGAPPRYAGER